MKKHQVYSLEVELLVQEEEAARQLQDRLSRMSGRVERLLDAHFSRHSPEAEERLLDRLELDLGVLPEEDFEEAFLAALAEVLDRKLPELPGVQAPGYTPVTGPTGVGMSSPGGEPGEDGGRTGPRLVARAAGPGMAPAAAPRVATVTALPPAGTPAGSVRKNLDLLEYFAHTGNLPWWAAPGSPELVAEQLHAARRDPAALQALLLRLSPPALARLEQATRPPAHPQIRRWWAPEPLKTLMARARLPLPGGAFPRAATERPDHRPSPSAGLQRADVRPPLRTPGPDGLGPQHIGRPGQKATGIPTTSLPGRPSPTPAGQALDSSIATREKYGSSSPHRQPPLAPRRALLRSSPLPTRPVAPPPARRAVEELVVPDAGLVLLWPFLPRYLQKLGWVDERPGFVDEVRRMWAIFQLGLLSDGRPPREHWLGLPKLLCGVEPESFWFLPGEPAEAERIAAAEEGERLLAAVIAHVRALRDPPVAAFQKDFLRREGILSRRSPRWLLRVQPAPQDLLLPQFPWTWAWIRLPWMDAALEVEW